MKRFLVALFLLMATTAGAYQASIVVPNGTGAQVRTNMNNALQAITTLQSGVAAPSTTYAYQGWVDTSTSPPTYKIRNSANTAWIAIGTLNDSGLVFTASSASNASTVGGFAPSQSGGANKVLATNASGHLLIGGVTEDGINTLQIGGSTGCNDFRAISGDSYITYISGQTLNIRNSGGTAVAKFDGSNNLLVPGIYVNTTTSKPNVYVASDGTLKRSTAAFRGALVYLNASESLNPSTAYQIPFTQEAYDTDAIHDTGTNTTRLTVPTGVTKIRLLTQVVFSGKSDATLRSAYFKKNAGANFSGNAVGQIAALNHATYGTYINITTPVLTVTSGDYFELTAYHEASSSLNLGGNSFGNATWFAMEIIE